MSLAWPSIARPLPPLQERRGALWACAGWQLDLPSVTKTRTDRSANGCRMTPTLTSDSKWFATDCGFFHEDPVALNNCLASGFTPPKLSDRSSVQHLVQHLSAYRGICRSIAVTDSPAVTAFRKT
jgi:hypothetical protein